MDTVLSPIGAGTMTPQTATPTTGQTVVMTSDSANRTIWLTPAGPLLALTVTLPSDANSVLGQIVRIGSTQVVTTLTINGAGGILNPVTTLAANDLFSFQKVAANTWARLLS